MTNKYNGISEKNVNYGKVNFNAIENAYILTANPFSCSSWQTLFICPASILSSILSWLTTLEGQDNCRTIPKHSRSEEHTSELQSRENLVCRLLLEKKKNK